MDEARVRELCRQAYEFGWEFRLAVGRPARLKEYASRYGKAFRSAGVSLREGLKSDSRFRVMMDAQGRYEVDIGVHPIEARVREALAGGPLSWDGLVATSQFKGSGIKAGELVIILEMMQKEGEIELVDRVWSLV